MPKASLLQRLAAFLDNRRTVLILVAAPLIVVAMILWSAVFNMFSYYRVANDNMSIGDVAIRLAALAYNAPRYAWNSLLVTLDKHEPPVESALPTLRLRVELGSMEKMAANLPISAKERYYPAWLQYPDGQWRQVRYRYRGRSRWHWMPEKPSLRLQLRRGMPLDLRRHINMVNPEDRVMVSNYMADELARRLGVLSSDTQFARVFINNQYFGVYHLSLREDESYLRKQRRVMGPIFIGENVSDPWRAETFEVAGDTADLNRFNAMAALIKEMYGPKGPDRYIALWKILSQDSYARWLAVMALTAGTHTDFFHNHLYFFDPSMGKLEPGVVDVNGHGMFDYPLGRKQLTQGFEPDPTIPMNESREPLRDVTLRDPRFYHLRNVKLFEAMNGVASAAAQNRHLDEVFAAIDPDVKADARKGGMRATFAGGTRLPFSNGQYDAEKVLLRRWIRDREDFLRENLARTRVAAFVAPAGDDTIAMIEVSGHAATDLDIAALPGRVFADRALDGTFIEALLDTTRLYPGLLENRGEMHRFVRVYPVPPYYLDADTQRYLFRFEGAGPASVAAALAGAFHNAVTGATIRPVVETKGRIDPADVVYNTVSQHAWTFPPPATGEVVLGPGEVRLTEDLTIAESQQLTVRAGTTLRLGSGVSIVSRGRATFDGTAEAPIRISRLDPSAPWGSLVLIGKAAGGSVLRHLRAAGGSVGRADHARLTGMVSVLGADAVKISNVEFTSNTLSDDLLHVVYGDVTISDSVFADCYADCIDIDYSAASLSGLSITRAGNDGVDFMTSTSILHDIRVEGADDKGLSIGEASAIEVDGLSVSGAVQGIAVKDASTVKMTNGRLSGNQTAVAVFAKNWRYGGPGALDGERVVFDDNDVSLSVERRGRVTLHGQALPQRRHGDGTMESRQ
ncbi:MAG: CotH kinase family protein [Proteobacteria bacterium]|nr:CotH kinase family protein [Pseudomonadota bacterium]